MAWMTNLTSICLVALALSVSLANAPEGTLMNRLVLPFVAAGYFISAPIAAGEKESRDGKPILVIFDTDIQGDVDDVGAVAALHALADRGETKILAMGISAKHPACAPCLDAINTYFGRPDIPIGVNQGKGFLRNSKYARQIADEFPHDLKSADEAPDARALYRRVLARQSDRSVVMISVGQVSNFSSLLKTDPDPHSSLSGRDLVRRKVKAWVCMGGKFPDGREANLVNHAEAATYAVKHWPTPIVFSGYEIGVRILTGGRTRDLPPTSPVRRAYELYNGNRPHKSWDQTAVLYAVRGLDGGLDHMWDLNSLGHCHVLPNGHNQWRPEPDMDHALLVEKMPPADVAPIIEVLMIAKDQPRPAN